MKFQLFVLTSLLAVGILFSCIQNPASPENVAYYFNSFEAPKDTTDWQGISFDMFINEPGPNGGRKSLFIGCGCFQPAASINLRECTENSEFKISFWAKIKENNLSGSILLSVMDRENKLDEIAINVVGNDWTFYQSDKSIFCAAGNFLRIEMMIGGIKAVSMNVDLLKIEVIK